MPHNDAFYNFVLIWPNKNSTTFSLEWHFKMCFLEPLSVKSCIAHCCEPPKGGADSILFLTLCSYRTLSCYTPFLYLIIKDIKALKKSPNFSIPRSELIESRIKSNAELKTNQTITAIELCHLDINRSIWISFRLQHSGVNKI